MEKANFSPVNEKLTLITLNNSIKINLPTSIITCTCWICYTFDTSGILIYDLNFTRAIPTLKNSINPCTSYLNNGKSRFKPLIFSSDCINILLQFLSNLTVKFNLQDNKATFFRLVILPWQLISKTMACLPKDSFLVTYTAVSTIILVTKNRKEITQGL